MASPAFWSDYEPEPVVLAASFFDKVDSGRGYPGFQVYRMNEYTTVGRGAVGESFSPIDGQGDPRGALNGHPGDRYTMTAK